MVFLSNNLYPNPNVAINGSPGNPAPFLLYTNSGLLGPLDREREKEKERGGKRMQDASWRSLLLHRQKKSGRPDWLTDNAVLRTMITFWSSSPPSLLYGARIASLALLFNLNGLYKDLLIKILWKAKKSIDKIGTLAYFLKWFCDGFFFQNLETWQPCTEHREITE